MEQVTIYLEYEIENRMKAAAKSAHLSKSKWVANEWPRSIIDSVRSWEDFSTIENIRKNSGIDAKREAF